MSLKNYRDAYHFLGGHFPDADFRGMHTHRDIVNELIDMNTDIGTLRIIKDISLILQIEPFPWKEIQDETNVYLENEGKGKAWLQDIYNWLCEGYEKKYGKLPIDQKITT